MGCCYSRLERKEMVSRCKARKRYMKEFVKARQAFSAAHIMYLKSLRDTGTALLQFATVETNHHLPPITASSPPPPPPPPPPLPSQPSPHPPIPMSPTSDTWTTTTTSTSASVRPPPPPPPAAMSWDFWDPFMPSASRAGDEEDWEETTTASEAAVTTVGAVSGAAPPSVVSGFNKDNNTIATTTTTTSSELAVVVSTKSKELVDIIKELDDYFLKAADAGSDLSRLLEVPACNFNQGSTGKDFGYGKGLNPLLLTWGSASAKWNAFGKFCDDPLGHNVACTAPNGTATHCSTVERLYAWEKKLYQEVKNAESLKLEHEKKAAHLRKLEMERADYIKTEKAKKEVEKLESQLMVASQAIETTSAEIIRVRESELYPQVVELVKQLMIMWKSMYEHHQVQKHIVQQLKFLNSIPSTDPTSEIHRQSTLQLEVGAQQWQVSFCNLVKAQRDYIQSLTGWLRLSLFQVGSNQVHKTKQDSAIYSLCEEWHLAINNAPDKVASEGIQSFLMIIHAIVVQQAEEQKQKKRSESVFKELEKKMNELRSLEGKYGPYSMLDASSIKKDPVREKRAKVESLRARAEDEKAKYEKSVSVTRAMTLNNLQMGLPHVFEALTGFANVWSQAFESVYNQVNNF